MEGEGKERGGGGKGGGEGEGEKRGGGRRGGGEGEGEERGGGEEEGEREDQGIYLLIQVDCSCVYYTLDDRGCQEGRGRYIPQFHMYHD